MLLALGWASNRLAIKKEASNRSVMNSLAGLFDAYPLIAGLFEAYPKASSTKVIAGLFDKLKLKSPPV